MPVIELTQEQVLDTIDSINDRIEALYDNPELHDSPDMIAQAEALEDIIEILEAVELS